jgi:hypothetical protein
MGAQIVRMAPARSTPVSNTRAWRFHSDAPYILNSSAIPPSRVYGVSLSQNGASPQLIRSRQADSLHRWLLSLIAGGQRNTVCFFAGTTNTSRKTWVSRVFLTPKAISRSAMTDVLTRLLKESSRIKTEGIAVAPLGGLSQADYSAKLMDSRVCLAPRGNIPDTFRYFEGVRSGCLVVCEPLPDSWYYRDAPVLQLDDWKDLEPALATLISDEHRMEEMRLNTLDYWNRICGERAVGIKMAEHVRARLNTAK